MVAAAAPVVAALLSASGCGAGATAQALRPKAPTYAAAVGHARCLRPSNRERPLVVDLDPRQRGDLEVAMKRGVAVVAYDCNQLKILSSCQVSGRYDYLGMTVKEQRIRLDDADEVGANLPFSGAALGAKLAAGFARGAALEVHLMMVGKQVATVSRVGAGALSGDCAGATHFIAGATLGGFSLKTVAKAKVAAEAGIAGATAKAESKSEHQVHDKDGDPEACRAAAPDAGRAPDRCGALVSLDLAGLSRAAVAAAAPSSTIAEVSACPAGWVRRGHKCARPSPSAPHQCDPGDGQDCRSQCDRGHLGSCINHAVALLRDRSIPAGAARARPLLRRACEAGWSNGCNNLGALLVAGDGGAKDIDRAASLFHRACYQGNAKACGNLAGIFFQAKTRKARARAAAAARRGCLGQDGVSCMKLGHAFNKGLGVERDPAQALAYQRRACKLGEPRGCNAAGLMIERHGGSPLEALPLFEIACLLKLAQGCVNAGARHFQGKNGVPRDGLKGVTFWLQACKDRGHGAYGTDGRDRGYAGAACYLAGAALINGVNGVPQRRTEGLACFAHGCNLGDGKSCDQYRRIAGSAPPPADALPPLVGDGPGTSRAPAPAVAAAPSPAAAAATARAPDAEASPASDAEAAPSPPPAAIAPASKSTGFGWLFVSMLALAGSLTTGCVAGATYLRGNKASEDHDREGFESAQTLQRAMIGTSIGLAAVGAGLMTYYLAADHGGGTPETPSTTAGVRLLPQVGPHGVSLGASWRF